MNFRELINAKTERELRLKDEKEKNKIMTDFLNKHNGDELVYSGPWLQLRSDNKSSDKKYFTIRSGDVVTIDDSYITNAKGEKILWSTFITKFSTNYIKYFSKK